jgi:TolB protein
MNCSEPSLGRRWHHRILVILITLASGTAASGAEPVRLTRDGTFKLGPVFKGGSDQVAFATHEVPNLVSIVCVKLSDGSRHRLHPSVVNHQFDPAFSRDGRYHAYGRSSTSPQMVLVIEDTLAKKDSVYKPRESRATARNPSFAADGARVVFSLSDLGGHQIASVNLQGQDLKHLTHASGMNAWPVYSPDGRKIAFGSSRSDDFEIYVMNADGSDVVRLTRSPGFDARPAWSPDGKRIAFTSNRDGNYDIYVVNADGSNPVNATSNPSRDDHVAWHPDGRQLLFVSDRDGGSDLYLGVAPDDPPKSGPS